MKHVVPQKMLTRPPQPADQAAVTAYQLLSNAVALLPMGGWSCDLESEQLSWTDGVFAIFGMTRDEPPDRRSTLGLYSEESRTLLERVRRAAIEQRHGFTMEAAIRKPGGDQRWIRITAAASVSNGRTRQLYGMKQDITADRARWLALRERAELDPLTGIANRARFQHFLQAPRGTSESDDTGALLLLDVDNFKLVNDRWGHVAGDACLVALARILRRTFPQAQLVARIGGDEFAVRFHRSEQRARIEQAVRALIATSIRPVPWNGDLLPLSVSAGLTFASAETACAPEQLFARADEALYTAKKNGLRIVANG